MPTSRLPRITLVTPSFNQVRFLEACLRSILDQQYPDLEYMVMDGGSKDGSAEVILRTPPEVLAQPARRRTVRGRGRGNECCLRRGDGLAELG